MPLLHTLLMIVVNVRRNPVLSGVSIRRNARNKVRNKRNERNSRKNGKLQSIGTELSSFQLNASF